MKKKDIILFAGIILVAVIGMLALNLSKEEGDYIRVTVDGELYAKYRLNDNNKYTISCSENDYNILVIENGYGYILDANCPDQLCMHQKRISKSGELLVCLPHKLIVSVVSDQKSEVDGVTY